MVYLDHFGNAVTNIRRADLKLDRCVVHSVVIGDHRIPLTSTYSAVPEGNVLALIGSSELLEIAIRNRNAAQELGISRNTKVMVEFSNGL